MTWFRIASVLAVFLGLVSRIFAADIVWVNTAGGNWSDPVNWSPQLVPGASNRAYITNDGTYTVTVDIPATVGALIVGGVSGIQSLDSPSFTLTLDGAGGPSTVGVNGILNLSGGTLAGGGLLDIGGVFNWTGGAVSGSGSLSIASVGTLNV